MKNILFIPIGGTICTSSDNNGILSVNSKSAYLIKNNFENSDSLFARDIIFDVTPNLMILSENITIDKWNLMFNIYLDYVSKKDYDGVIIAHGTDTLAYSASLFSMLLSGTKIPVFFVSSNKSLEHNESNGNANFKAAAELIYTGIEPNVYVTYKNPSDNTMYLHLGSRIEQCKNYSEDFTSYKMIKIPDTQHNKYDEILKTIKNNYPSTKKNTLNFGSNPKTLQNTILTINPYVGLKYDAFDYKKFDAVLHTTYHSGTVCSDKNDINSILYMINLCNKEKIDIYLSPARSYGELYESIISVRECKNIRFLYGYTDECAYAKLLIAYSYYENQDEIKKFLTTELNYEYITNEQNI